MKKIVFYVALLSLLSCKSPIIRYQEFNGNINKHSEKLLKAYKANDHKFSLLVFADGMKNQKIIVINKNDILLDRKLTSDRSMGLATALRINNRNKVKIIDYTNNYKIQLSSKQLKKYKYIYIDCKIENSENPYTITFSNSLRSFY